MSSSTPSLPTPVIIPSSSSTTVLSPTHQSEVVGIETKLREEMEAELDQTAEGMGGPSPLTAEIEQKFLISYYVFADAFTVNLKGSRKVMQAKIGLSTYYDEPTMFNEEEGAEGWVPRHLVGIRAEILKVLRTTTEDQLATPESEKLLLEEIRMVVNETLEKYEKTTAAPIEEAYFTEFIIQ